MKSLALAGLLLLTGCVTDQPQAVITNTPMPLDIDTSDHRIVNAPVKRPDGRVDPDDTAPSRSRNFGPETMATPASLRAELAAFRATLPSQLEAGSYLALAKSRKPKRAIDADRIDTDPPEDDDASAGHDDNPQSADNRGVEDQDGGYKLNFEDAEIKDVLQAVLGHVLGLTYTIAPNVMGRITISSSASQSRTELLSTLETVLALQGLSLTRNGSTYRVAPTSIGGGAVDDNGKEPGFGISVVPLQYSSVASMSKLLSGFLTDADGVRIDTTRNAVIVRGPGPRRAEIVRAIKAFDDDWMQTQSVSVVELRRSHPEEIIGELSRIFDNDPNGGGAGVIHFKAIKRLRAIMVISKSPVLIRRATSWIRRLDHHDTSDTSSVFVYRPRYRDARELTRLINGLFGQSDNSPSNGSSVNFQQGQGGQGSSGQGGQPSSQPGPIGMSSASYAGALSPGTSSAAPGSSSSGGSGSFGSGGSFGGGGGGSQGSGGGNPGSGLQGAAADPIDANAGPGNGGSDKLKLTADTSNNTIVAYTDGETYGKVRSILTQLDVPPLQVAINVVIAEVQLNDELKFGVQFYLNSHNGSIGLGDTATQVLASKLPGANLLLGAATSPEVAISALDTISKVHILSTPSIVVMENKPATFEVGNQVPVVTQTAQSNLTADAPSVNSVTYLDTGIILKIVPRIGQNGSVAMDLDQVISSVVPDASGATSGSLTPTISKRHIASDISVRSGQTVLLAGLINDTKQESNGQIPFVGSTLGSVLGNTDNQYTRDELIIFIRPVIIRDGKDASSVTKEFQRSLKDIQAHAPPVYKP